VPTTYPARTHRPNYRRPRWRRFSIVVVVLAALLGGACYAGYHYISSIINQALPPSPGCQAGTGVNALPIDQDQAPVAATIAGVAARMGLPIRALEIAYATGLQESKLTNLTYGDRDSVGVFQQRPSEGWGTVAELEDPQYASTAFFKALVKVPNYLTIPEYQAAQDVQHSADGSAYEQWQATAVQLATAYTASAHTVTCWYTPSTTGHPEVAATRTRLAQVFGPTGPASDGAVLQAVTTSRSGLDVRVRAENGWTVANWLMSHASMYGVTKISYNGWKWSASLTETSWQHAPGGSAGSILAS
jgi:hypothetical protein